MSSDRVASAAARRQDQDLAGRPGIAVAPSDPYLAGWLGLYHGAYGSFRYESGQVVDAAPGGAAYLVDAGQTSCVWCSPGGTTAGFGAWGGRPLHTFPIGTHVHFVRHPQTPTIGTIVGAEPPWANHSAFHPADGIWPFTRSGHRVEAAHQFPVRASADVAAAAGAAGGVDVPDLSGGRPIDATGVGEWGVMMETGVGVFADPFQAYLRVDEATGVFAFYQDQLLRVAGENYQHFTAHHEHEELDDAGELLGYSRRFVYPWERYGVWWPNQITPNWRSPAAPRHGLAAGQGTRLTDPFRSQDGSGDAVRDVERYDQVSCARVLEWYGYLGQGGRRVVALPAQHAHLLASPGAQAQAKAAAPTLTPDSAAAPSGRLSVDGNVGPADLGYEIPPNHRTGGPDQPGMLEFTQTVAGGYRVRTARHIILAKYPSIPVPRQLTRPEDPYGDDATSYRPSGWAEFGAGVEHRVAVGLAAPGGSPQRAVMLPDALAYLFNWEGLAPFAYHTDDWAVAQEGDAGTGIRNQRTPAYADLAADQYLAAPAPAFVAVDHRYGDQVPVYENQSHVVLADDGSVFVGDGWGSEIRLGGGNIELHCAGDVALYPGRNLITWAGHDVVLRAHDSVDVTAANGDLRTKADKSHHAMAGNSGFGGFLFETKAVCPIHRYENRAGEEVVSSGFTVLAPRSQFAVLAGDVALSLENTSSDGRIYLDAGHSRHIHTYSRTVVNQITPAGAVVHLFDGDGTAPRPTANEFSATYSLFSRDVLLGEDLYVAGAASFDKTVGVRKDVTARVPGGYAATRTQVRSRMSYLAGEFRSAYRDEVVFPPQTEAVEFGLRTAAQYRSVNYEYWQPRWRALSGAAGQVLTAWSEPEVAGLRSGGISLPHPGVRWTEGLGYRAYPLTHVDTARGWVAVDRDDPINRGLYETAHTETPTDESLADNYVVPVPAGNS